MKDSDDIVADIDSDEGLKSKRKSLTVASVTLLALSFSGATIEEANTFIFKIKFPEHNGLGILLVLAIFCLMVRYYNYAVVYHEKLYERWSQRLLNHPSVYYVCPHSDALYGYMAKHLPVNDDYVRHYQISWSYKCRFPFRRSVVFRWTDNYSVEQVASWNIRRKSGFKVYLHVLWLEAKEQSSSFLRHRENLDILAPYVLGCLAIGSYFFKMDLMDLLLFLTSLNKN